MADRRERRIAWAARLGALFVRAIGATWRIRVAHDEEVLRLRAEGCPIVFTLWHGELLPLIYHHRGERVAILVSEHSDGEIIARIAQRLGYRTVRGSTSRGAARALLELSRVLEEGTDLAITPDGPRGPAKSFAVGALVVAQRAGAPVIGASAFVSRGWRLGSWDRFLIPKPFARVQIAYAPSFRVAGEAAREAEGSMDRALAAMASAEERARG
ncbi:MAG TPA: lysophospholipid acyltransferase family protein [Gemmatimonadaceae bacterium]|nr:lysophospholipid acyltransferase family protein [Gemmatimonadaceae bacterium]